MEDKKHNENFFGLLQTLIYILILVNVYFTCIYQPSTNMVVLKLVYSVSKLGVFTGVIANHLLVSGLILVVAFATRSKKDIEYQFKKHFSIPFFIGLCLFFASFLGLHIEDTMLQSILYGLTYIIGSVLLHTSLSNLSKILGIGLKKDVWNEEQQSFAQNKELVKADYLLNIPMQFYHNKKMIDG